MPPKRTTSLSSNTATRTASGFFQQVKKPTTAANARTITPGKKNVSSVQQLKQAGHQPVITVPVEEKDREPRQQQQERMNRGDNDEEEDEIDEAEFDDDFAEQDDDDEVSTTKADDLKVFTQKASDEIVFEDSEDELESRDQQLLESDEEEVDEDERLYDETKPSATKAAAAIKKTVVTVRQQQQKKNLFLRKDNVVVVPDVGDIHSGFHQHDLSALERTLRQFDLTQKYGPCTDTTRLERWERAFALGLNPPQEVKDALIANPLHNKALFSGRV